MRKIIEQLLNSDLSSNHIATESGVQQSTVHRLRTGERSLDNLGLKNAEKLYDYEMERMKMTELNNKIVEVENPNNIVESENLQEFFSDIEEMSNGTFKVDFETLEKVEHDNGSTYYMVTTNSTEEIKFNDKVDDENIETLYDRWLEKDQGEETYIESMFFENEQDAKDYIKVVLKGYDTFKECAKTIGVIE